MTRFRSLTAFLLAILASLTLSESAHAQGMMGGLGLTAPISTADIDDMSKFLDMSDDQRATALDMHTAYLSTYEGNREVLTEAFQAAMQEAQQTNDMTVWNDLSKMIVDFEKSSKAAVDNLFEDIQLILSEDQLSEWPAYEIRSFRKRTLPTVSGQGMTVSGSSTDLIAIYEDNIKGDIDDEQVTQSLDTLLASYEREMDTALHSFVEVRNEVTEDSLEIGTDWMNNMDKLDEIISTYVGAAVKIRDVNDRFTGRIAAILPAEPRKEWERSFNKNASPAIYTDNYIDQSFDAALELADLTEDQRTRIDEVRSRYLASESTINAKWASALRDSEEKMSLQAMMQGQMQSDEATALKKERSELDAKAYDDLSAILTEEQRENLPAKPASDWRNRFQFNDGN